MRSCILDENSGQDPEFVTGRRREPVALSLGRRPSRLQKAYPTEAIPLFPLKEGSSTYSLLLREQTYGFYCNHRLESLLLLVFTPSPILDTTLSLPHLPGLLQAGEARLCLLGVLLS